MRFHEPKDGAMRVRTKFLWFPICIGRETRWLEVATWTEKYDPCYYATGWEPIAWGDALAGKDQSK